MIPVLLFFEIGPGKNEDIIGRVSEANPHLLAI